MINVLTPEDFSCLYTQFEAPISALDCGEKCAPYNEGGIPFCCDTRHAVPTAYAAEWQYLHENTTLWHTWHGATPQETAELQAETPAGQVLIECLGAAHCQRGFRSLTCRAFPFYPYITSQDEFLGLAFYWEYRDRCWVANHLEVVSDSYRCQFVNAFNTLFARQPEERAHFAAHSQHARQHARKIRRTIPIIHRDGGVFKIRPTDESLLPANPTELPKYGDYRIAHWLRFADET